MSSIYKSSIYKFFTKVEISDRKKSGAFCKNCTEILSWRSSVLVKHVKRKHYDTFKEYLKLEKTVKQKALKKKEITQNATSGTSDIKFVNDLNRAENGRVECPSSNSLQSFELYKDNCFVCYEKLTSCRTKLSFKTKLTSTALYEILG